MNHVYFSDQAKKDMAALRKADVKAMAKLIDLILDIMNKNPHKGLGKPEELKGNL